MLNKVHKNKREEARDRRRPRFKRGMNLFQTARKVSQCDIVPPTTKMTRPDQTVSSIHYLFSGSVVQLCIVRYFLVQLNFCSVKLFN